MCETPVMICGFNRPDCLRQVLDAVRAAKVPKLYLVLDAPREGRPDDRPGYLECRKMFDSIDWPCEVKRNYSERNMGCGARMTSGISWVFEHEERAIILEDDCVPHPSFLRFCDELLERYKDDGRVGMIAAECEHFRKAKVDFHGDSYYFDRMCLVWGWATWRRAWALHDPSLAAVGRMIDTDVMMNVFQNHHYARQWARDILRIRDGKQKTWAGAWATTIYRENLLVAHTVVNPVLNVGQGMSSREWTPTETFRSPVEVNRTAEEIHFPLQHPLTMIPNVQCERYCFEDMLYRANWKKALENPRLAMKKLWRRLCK